MELSRNKRIILGITFISIVVLTFLAGYMLANVKPSKLISNDAKNEIIDLLDKYYYKEYDKKNFDKKSLKAAVSSLNDPYTYLYFTDNKTDSGYYGYGFASTDASLGLKVSKVYDNSPASTVGLQAGDYVIGVDSLTMDNSNIDDISDYLTSATSEVTLLMLRDYKKYSVKLTKANITVNSVEYELLESIGYIKINEFNSGVSKKFNSALEYLESKNITGLIIDVRNNPGGLASEVSAILRNFLTGNDAFLYLEDNSGKPEIYRATNATKKSYDIKVLINQNSASASEVFALAMNRAEGYDLIGENTFGKNVFQSDYEVSSLDNAYLHITRGYWYGPNKEKITDEGIAPTVSIIDHKYVAMPINEKTYEKGVADEEIKNIELMLNGLDYDVRNDGYFDDYLESTLTAFFESNVLDYNTKKTIFDSYISYINNKGFDLALTKAIELLN